MLLFLTAFATSIYFCGNLTARLFVLTYVIGLIGVCISGLIVSSFYGEASGEVFGNWFAIGILWMLLLAGAVYTLLIWFLPLGIYRSILCLRNFDSDKAIKV